MNKLFALTFLGALLFSATSYAQLTGGDTKAGDTCNAGEEGYVRRVAEDDYSTDAIELICDGSNWQAITSSSVVWQDGATAGEIYYSGGNVGIGESDPAAKLEIQSSGLGLYFDQTAAADQYIRWHVPMVKWWTAGPKTNGDYWFTNSSDHASLPVLQLQADGDTKVKAVEFMDGTRQTTAATAGGVGLGSCRLYLQGGTGSGAGGYSGYSSGNSLQCTNWVFTGSRYNNNADNPYTSMTVRLCIQCQ